MYSEAGLEMFLKHEFSEDRRLLDHVAVSGTRIVLTTKNNHSKAILTNYNGIVPLKDNCGELQTITMTQSLF